MKTLNDNPYDNGATVGSKRTVLWHYYAKIKGADMGNKDKRYLLIFPDSFTESDWTSAMGTRPETAFDGSSEQNIAYTAANFTAMQNAGIVILPAAGNRYYNSQYSKVYSNDVGDIGYYWSCTSAASAQARRLIFSSSIVAVENSSTYNINKDDNHFPVRLVREIE